MKVLEIFFPFKFAELDNPKTDIVDVVVTLENGCSYTILVATPSSIESLFQEDHQNYLPPRSLFLIVRELSQEIIEDAIKAYSKKKAYWLRLYSEASRIDVRVFDKLDHERALIDEIQENLGDKPMSDRLRQLLGLGKYISLEELLNESDST